MRHFALLLALAVALPARAREGSIAFAPAADADSLFRAGRDALKAGDLARACRAFAGSLRLERAPGTLLNLAECEERRGRAAEAYRRLREALAALAPEDDRFALARRRAAALEPRIARVHFAFADPLPDGATVAWDGVPVDPARLDEILAAEAGSHVAQVRAPGAAPILFAVRLAAGELRELSLWAGAPAPSRSIDLELRAERPRLLRRSNPVRAAGFAVGALGLASLVVAIATDALMASYQSQLASECVDHMCPPDGVATAQAGYTLQILSAVAWGVGAAAVATGLVLVLVGRSHPVRAQLAPALGPGSAGLTLAGSF